MDFFYQHKTVIVRTLGALMLIVGFATHFWATPKKGLSENERAAANVARMEARLKGKSTSTNSREKDTSKFLEKIKNAQSKQMEYMTILAMVLGGGFLAYSFMPKKEEKA